MYTSLSLRPIVNIEINLAAKASARKGFNLGMVLTGETPTGWPLQQRVKKYTGYEGVAKDFGSEAEVAKAAVLYFSQRPMPTRLAVGLLKAPETVEAAFMACRAADSEWYAFTFSSIPSDEDILKVAEKVEAAQPTTAYFQTLKSPDILSNPSESLPAQLQNKKFRRTHTVYSTKSDYSILATIGYAMAANDGTEGSAYTLKFKQQVGIETENLEEDQVEALHSINCNVYVLRDSYYSMYENGVQADGTSFDELIFLDQFANEAQLNIMDALYQAPKIAQTDAGVSGLIQYIQPACDDLVYIGFCAPGMWKGQTIMDLKYGMTLPKGYLIMAESIDSQPQADREARKSPHIYIALKLAGAIEYVLVRVNVNR